MRRRAGGGGCRGARGGGRRGAFARARAHRRCLLRARSARRASPRDGARGRASACPAGRTHRGLGARGEHCARLVGDVAQRRAPPRDGPRRRRVGLARQPRDVLAVGRGGCCLRARGAGAGVVVSGRVVCEPRARTGRARVPPPPPTHPRGHGGGAGQGGGVGTARGCGWRGGGGTGERVLCWREPILVTGSLQSRAEMCAPTAQNSMASLAWARALARAPIGACARASAGRAPPPHPRTRASRARSSCRQRAARSAPSLHPPDPRPQVAPLPPP